MQLRVLTLNIWGVRFIAKFIDQRLRALVEHLNDAHNNYDIIGLQEVRRTGEDERIERFV
jgi:sphingomyelin phosphodiesterase 2